MTILIAIGQITAALIAVIFAFFMWSYQYWKKKNVPYIEPQFPFGSLQVPFLRKITIGEEVANMYKYAKSKGWKYCGFYNVASPALLSVDIDITKEILCKSFNHFTDRGTYYNERDDPITAHLFSIGGDKWRNLRAKLSPTFTSGKMKGMFSTLVACGETLERFIDKEIQNQEAIEIKADFVKYSTDIIGSCAFGIDCNSFEDPNSRFIQIGRSLFRRSTIQNLKFMIALAFPNVARFLRVTIFPKEISDFYFKLVKDTVSYRRKNNVVRPDFLQLLIEILHDEDGFRRTGDGKTLTIEEAVAQCTVFFIAGFETSSTTMTFALFELSRHLDLQEKLRQEIQEVLKKHDNQITYESIKEMTYLRQVLDETLRKYPALPFITRECVQDWQVPGSDVIVEKGTRVFIPIMGCHYDAEYFKEPEVFDPDRFSEENRESIPQYAHIPFGEGPRQCIGLRFGIMQSSVGLISVLKNYKVTLSSKTKVPLKYEKNVLIPNAVGGIWLDVKRIEK